jgi:glycosyltransferase involved in cell wall biosynthesis
MKKIAVIAICNFIETPTGGEVTFLNSILKVKQQDDIKLCLIGMTNEMNEVEGKWANKAIGNIDYNFIPVFKEIRSKEQTKIPYRLRFIFGLIKYRKLIEKESFDYIYIHCPEIILGLGNKIINKSKLIYHVHGEPSNTIRVSRFKLFRRFEVISKIYLKIIDKCIKNSAKVIWVSKRGLQNYAKISMIRKIDKKSVVIENPYDSKIFVYDNVQSVCKDNIECVFVGRLSKSKNIGLAIRAIKELNNESIFFTICGDGEERENLEELSKELDIYHKINFRGNVGRAELAQILQKTDIFLLPSLNEGSPVCIPEALAMGNAVISTDVGDVSDIVVNNFNGIIVEDFEVITFAKAINNIINKDLEKVKKNAVLSSKYRGTEKISRKIIREIITVE